MSENTTDKIRIGITQGDINGIGCEVILKLFEDERILELATPVIYGSAKALAFYRKAIGLAPLQYNSIERGDEATDGRINLVNTESEDVKIEPGTASREAGMAAFAALEAATSDLREGNIDALLTAPINKNSIQSDEFRFPGHTEYLESVLGEGDHSRALMILCNEHMRVALVTTHAPISEVASMITKESVGNALRRLQRSLIEDFGVTSPRIAVLALNPHAGENGLLGKEEQEEITPAIEQAREEGIVAFGPYAADGFFGNGGWRKFDAILAMYHDQGLIPLKLLGMESGVNFTAGLPYVRTSPDHGTAYDIAGRGEASAESMRAALYAAIDTYRNRCRHAEATANPLKKQAIERKPRKDKPERAKKPETPAEEENNETTAEE